MSHLSDLTLLTASCCFMMLLKYANNPYCAQVGVFFENEGDIKFCEMT